eukprot:11211018-Alexandrium_andersonii.AAC.1
MSSANIHRRRTGVSSGSSIFLVQPSTELASNTSIILRLYCPWCRAPPRFSGSGSARPNSSGTLTLQGLAFHSAITFGQGP